ncbi:MAG TPA: PilZ domain-containing protein [Patescibacteria group bacterium]|nr:PilZ domain-containing protein [Patescibacteria group bacterium]
MKKHPKIERRLHPRVEKTLPLNIVANGYDLETTTKNVSCVGAYCHINKYIPPFTKIAVRLILPITRGLTRKTYDVECRGVVVRTEDQTDGGFNVAIFFNGIKDAQRQRISQYIHQFLP